MSMRRRVFGAFFCISALGCSPAQSGKSPAANGSASAASSNAGAPTGTREELRDRALTAIDAGDLLGAEASLLELVRRDKSSVGARALLHGLRGVTGRDAILPYIFANVTPIRIPTSVVGAPSAAEKGEPPRIAIEKIRNVRAQENDNDVESTIRRWQGRIMMSQHQPGEPQKEHPFLPSRLSGFVLTTFHLTPDQQWLASYGEMGYPARLVGLWNPKAQTSRVFDFRDWQGDGTVQRVSELTALGDTIYASVVASKNTSAVIAIHARTGKLLWRRDLKSETSGRCTIAGDTLYSLMWGEKPFLFALDRATGALKGRATLSKDETDMSALVSREGYLELYSSFRQPGSAVYGIRAPVKPESEPEAPAALTGSTSLPKAEPLPALVANARRDAYEALDAGRVGDALHTLRIALHMHSGNFALDSLYREAQSELLFARQRATDEFGKITPTAIEGKKAVAPTGPSKRGKIPRLRVGELRPSKGGPENWNAELGVDVGAIDDSDLPTPVPLPVAPSWLPLSVSKVELQSFVSDGDASLATYLGRPAFAAVFRSGKPAGLYRFGDGDISFLTSIGLSGDDLLAVYRDGKGDSAFALVDAKTGALRWNIPANVTTASSGGPGYVLAIGETRSGAHEIVLYEDDTGRAVARIPTPSEAHSWRWRIARAKDGKIWLLGQTTSAQIVVE